MPPLQRYIIALTGGLQDSRALAEPSDLVKLYNFTLFRGRFALRAPVKEIATVGSESHILDISTHLGSVWILTWNSANQDVDLYSMAFPEPTDTGWPTPVLESQVHTGVTTRPDMFLTSFSGGTETAPQDRIFVTDYNQALQTKYWVDSTSTLVAVAEDLDADSSLENVHFSLLAPYQFHLWGTGFYAEYGTGGDQLRPEMLRFSQPGMIPNVDPAGGLSTGGGAGASKEWFTYSYRNVGRRGDKIKAISYAAGNMMVFQKGSTHAVFGYGQDSWATKQLSDHIGCVGPRAATATDAGGLCFFWSHDGPFATDGSQLIPLGEDIRQHVIDVEASEKVSAAYSPDDGMVYFTLHPEDEDLTAGDPFPKYYLAYDTQRERWSDGSWLKGGGTAVQIPVSCMIPATSREISKAPGPVAPPDVTGSGATAYSHNSIAVRWDRGDLASDARTYVYRSTSSGFTPGAGNQLTYTSNQTRTRIWDNDLYNHALAPPSPRTTYYYKLLHWRNGEYSAESAESSARTWHEPAENVTSKPVSGGIELSYTIPATVTGTCDVKIQRSRAPEYLDFYDVTTVSGQTSGAKTYTDTGQHVAITAGAEYMYKVVLTASGETDSQEQGATGPVIAGGAGTSPSISVSNPVITLWPARFNRMTVAFYVNWSDLGPPDAYQIWAFEDYGSGYPSEPDAVFNPSVIASSGTTYWSYKVGGDDRVTCPGTTQLKVKFELRKFKTYRLDGSRVANIVVQTVTKDDGGGYYNPCSTWSP